MYIKNQLGSGLSSSRQRPSGKAIESYCCSEKLLRKLNSRSSGSKGDFFGDIEVYREFMSLAAKVLAVGLT